jgi:hypothetical protein
MIIRTDEYKMLVGTATAFTQNHENAAQDHPHISDVRAHRRERAITRISPTSTTSPEFVLRLEGGWAADQGVCDSPGMRDDLIPPQDS